MSSTTSSTSEWLGLLESARVPALGPVALSPAEVSTAIEQVARLRGELARLQAELVGHRVVETGRDTASSLTRDLGLSTAEAREAVNAAAVLSAHSELAPALASGQLQAGHLAAVRRVADPTDQAALLASASSQTVDEFRDTVRQFRISQAGPAWRDQERAARSVTFFRAENGCLGMHALLPSIDGARLRKRLHDIVNAKYKLEHPERAKVRGGHRVDDIEQRMADALVSLLDGDTSGVGAGGKAAVVVVVDPEKCEAEILGQGPIAFDDAVDLAADKARAEVYGIMQDTTGAIMKFGRNRRFASALQRLAIAVRDRRCVVDGCGKAATECDAHHEPPFDAGGRTDVELMEARCPAHHQYRHETGETGPLRSARHRRPNARSRSPDSSEAA